MDDVWGSMPGSYIIVNIPMDTVEFKQWRGMAVWQDSVRRRRRECHFYMWLSSTNEGVGQVIMGHH